jgi:hypothetical protein
MPTPRGLGTVGCASALSQARDLSLAVLVKLAPGMKTSTADPPAVHSPLGRRVRARPPPVGTRLDI